MKGRDDSRVTPPHSSAGEATRRFLAARREPGGRHIDFSQAPATYKRYADARRRALPDPRTRPSTTPRPDVCCAG